MAVLRFPELKARGDLEANGSTRTCGGNSSNGCHGRTGNGGKSRMERGNSSCYGGNCSVEGGNSSGRRTVVYRTRRIDWPDFDVEVLYCMQLGQLYCFDNLEYANTSIVVMRVG